jgi:hypothetical protein
MCARGWKTSPKRPIRVRLRETPSCGKAFGCGCVVFAIAACEDRRRFAIFPMAFLAFGTFTMFAGYLHRGRQGQAIGKIVVATAIICVSNAPCWQTT